MTVNFKEAEELNEQLGDAAGALRDAHKIIMGVLFPSTKKASSKGNIIKFERKTVAGHKTQKV